MNCPYCNCQYITTEVHDGERVKYCTDCGEDINYITAYDD